MKTKSLHRMKHGGAQTGALQQRLWREKHINSAVSRCWTNSGIIQEFIYEAAAEKNNMNPWTLQEHIRQCEIILHST